VSSFAFVTLGVFASFAFALSLLFSTIILSWFSLFAPSSDAVSLSLLLVALSVSYCYQKNVSVYILLAFFAVIMVH